MRKRWLLYTLIGLVFGWMDWYFLDFLASLSQNQALSDRLSQLPGIGQVLFVVIIMGLNFGVWLIPVIPVAIYEMKSSHVLWKAALSAILVWCMALLSYYAYYTFLLMFVGLPHLEFMLFSNRHSATYWTDWLPPFRRIILYQFSEWIGIGVIGGALVGTASATIYERISKKKAKQAVIGKA